MTPRTFREGVWCANFLRCGAIGDPGYEGGGHPMLCTACEADRLARAGQKPQTEPEPPTVETARERPEHPV